MWFHGRSREIERLSGMVRDQTVRGRARGARVPASLRWFWRASSPRSAPTARRRAAPPAGGCCACGPAVRRSTPADAAARLACGLHEEPDTAVPVLRDRALGLLRRGATGVQQVVVELGLSAGYPAALAGRSVRGAVPLHRRRPPRPPPCHRRATRPQRRGCRLGLGHARRQPDRYASRPRRDHHALGLRRRSARFLGLPEVVDAGQFLVPRISRAQLEAAVREPLRLAGASVRRRWSSALDERAGTQPDALPVLQHALSRTWERRAQRGSETAAAELAEAPAPFNSGLEELSPRPSCPSGCSCRGTTRPPERHGPRALGPRQRHPR